MSIPADLWDDDWRATLPWGTREDVSAIREVTDIQERCIEYLGCEILAADVELFQITGGPIIVTEFVGIVTENIQGLATTTKLIVDVATPDQDVDLSTAVDLDGRAAGTSITFTDATPGVLTPTTNGAVDGVVQNRWLCPIGKITVEFSADRDGEINWYMVYKPLSVSTKVAVL